MALTMALGIFYALPTGATWFLNCSGEASAAGDPLSQVQNLYGCRTDPSR